MLFLVEPIHLHYMFGTVDFDLNIELAKQPLTLFVHVGLWYFWFVGLQVGNSVHVFII